MMMKECDDCINDCASRQMQERMSAEILWGINYCENMQQISHFHLTAEKGSNRDTKGI